MLAGQKLVAKDGKEVALFPMPYLYMTQNEGGDFSHGHHAGRLATSCENRDSFSLAIEKTKAASALPEKNRKPVLVLNLANPVNPGGGVRHVRSGGGS